MSLLDQLRGGLIVSVQAEPGSALDDPETLAAIARAAQDGGASGVRLQGVANLAAARRRVTVPTVGLIKRHYDGFEPYITPTLAEVAALLGTGTEIVAFDATARSRPEGATLDAIVDAVHAGGALAMADCATLEDGRRSLTLKADIVATTLCGYTKETAGTGLPALELVRAFARLDVFAVCEGGIGSPASGRAAIEAGAAAIVVGTAISDTAWLVGEFVGALAKST